MGFFYLNLIMVVIKQTDTAEQIKIELLKLADKARKKKIDQLEPYFGILKGREDIDPLKLQKKWRGEW